MSHHPLELTKLSQKHRVFVEAYDGDAVYAMRVAGWNGSDQALSRKADELLSMPLIQEAIKERSRGIAKLKDIIATREERQIILTAVMRNRDPHYREEKDSSGVPLDEPNIPLPTRLKALELLGKGEGDFVDRIDLNVTKTITDVISESYHVDTPLEVLRAERDRLKLAKAAAIPAESKPIEISEPSNLEDLV